MGQIYSKKSTTVIPAANHFFNDFINNNSLSLVSLELLQEIQTENFEVFNALLSSLGEIVNRDKPSTDIVFAKPFHFDIVCEFIRIQRLLPENSQEVLNEYLLSKEFNIADIVQRLRNKYLSNIAKQAQNKNLAHHSVMHGEEIKNRVMQVICLDLKLFNSDSLYDVFMRHILMFALEFHDYIQGTPDVFPTVEEQTADLVLSWLISADGLGDVPSEIYSIISYQVLYIISIGTTVAFSVNEPLPLTKLLSIFQKSCLEAGLSVCHSSNHEFCRIIELVASIAGCFDTVPYIMNSANIRQSESRRLSSLNYLSSYSDFILDNISAPKQESQILNFMTNNLKSYLRLRRPSAYDFQAFLTGLVSKLGMRIEFSMNDKNEINYALLLGKFIRFMKTSYRHCLSDDSFYREFNELFDRFSIANAVEKIFMSKAKIDAEINFAKSNFNRAIATTRQIDEHLDVVKIRTTNSLLADNYYFSSSNILDYNSVQVDAKNIKNFYNFYLRLPKIKQAYLLKELVLNLTLQAGTLYLKFPEESQLLECQDNGFLPDLSHFDDFHNYADCVENGKFNIPANAGSDESSTSEPRYNITQLWQKNPTFSASEVKDKDLALGSEHQGKIIP